ncbi:MAG: hypothetical protein C5B49_15265 [Bdellovibrio sp.]|nr:MAG: hypothetical protein C5B49_15265 [Bdellovibrio sp.]
MEQKAFSWGSPFALVIFTVTRAKTGIFEMNFGVSPQTFVVCVRSIKDSISICDNSYTAQLDRVKPAANTDLKKLMDGIRGP